jgi:hypothetical protein
MYAYTDVGGRAMQEYIAEISTLHNLCLGACPRIERELRGSWFESVFALLLGE